MCETIKECNLCKETKPITEFHKAKAGKYGVTGRCKICRNKEYAPTPLPVTIFMDRKTRICTVCNIEKSFSEYCKSTKERSGVDQRCKSCQKELREKYKVIEKSPPLTGKKTCSKCKETLSVDFFVKDSSKTDGLNCSCKKCVRKYRDENKEKLKLIHQNYSKNNRPSINKAAKEWNIKNKEVDPLYSIKRSLPGTIKTSFTRACSGKFPKKGKSIEILGCTMDFFLDYIRHQWLEGMTWDNYGRCIDSNCEVWQLDHIYPISLAKTEEEIYQLNHYTNFRPLWAIDNIIKGNSIIEGHQLKLL